jgi:hypothetical protein
MPFPCSMPHFNSAWKFTLVAVCGLYLSAVQAASFSGKVVGIADGYPYGSDRIEEATQDTPG